MTRRRQEIRHEYHSLSLVLEDRAHLSVRMSVDYEGIKTQAGIYSVGVVCCFNEFKLAAFFERQDVLFKKACFFACIRLGRPFPVAPIRPIRGVFKRRFVARAVLVPLHGTTHVIKVEVG